MPSGSTRKTEKWETWAMTHSPTGMKSNRSLCMTGQWTLWRWTGMRCATPVPPSAGYEIIVPVQRVDCRNALQGTPYLMNGSVNLNPWLKNHFTLYLRIPFECDAPITSIALLAPSRHSRIYGRSPGRKGAWLALISIQGYVTVSLPL